MVQNKSRSFYWSAIYIDMLKYIALDKEMTGNHIKILLYLCYEMDSNNFVKIYQQELVKDLNYSKGTISKGIKYLNENQYIQKIKNKPKKYMINPSLIYTGKNRQGEREELKNEFSKILMENGKEKEKFIFDELERTIQKNQEIQYIENNRHSDFDDMLN